MPTVPESESPVSGPVPAKEEARLYLYDKAYRAIGEDLTPSDSIPDDVACVAQLQEVFRRATGTYIGSGAALYNTAALFRALLVDSRFRRVENPTVGTIVVNPTGYSTKDPEQKGHCGVWGKSHVMSNQSFGKDAGKWLPNYTHAAWKAYFEKKLAIPSYYFDLV